MTSIEEALKSLPKAYEERHGNGGGTVTSFVTIGSDSVRISEESVVRDLTELYEFVKVTGKSEVSGFVKLFGIAEVNSSTLMDHVLMAGDTQVNRSVIKGTCQLHGGATVSDSVLSGNVIICGNSNLSECMLSGNVRISGYADLYRVKIIDDVIISGNDTYITNCTLTPGVRITGGRWERSPYVVKTRYFNVCEDVEDRILIGCKSLPYHIWKQQAKTYFRSYFGSDDADKEELYLELLSALEDVNRFKQEVK